MTKDTVPANAEGMPKLNRSEILRSAWASYRRDKHMGLGVDRYGPFSRRHFAYCLRMAWAEAKERATRHAQVSSAPLAPVVRSPEAEARIANLRADLLAMDLSDAPINWNRYRDVSAELAAAYRA